MDEISEVAQAPGEPAEISMRAFPPGAALAPLVRRFELVEARAPATRTLFPDGGIILAFRYRGWSALVGEGAPWRLPDHAVTGLRPTVRRMHTAAGSAVLLAKLRDGGAVPFLDGPLHRLFGRTVPLARYFPAAELVRLSSQLASARGDEERVALLERFLLAHRAPRAPDPLALAAAGALRAARGSLRIADLARRLHVSLDALEKRFRRTIGASPKQLASILRLQEAVGGHRPGASLSWLALESGYADQSHFVRALRRATGEPPGAFLRRGDRC